VLDNLLIYQLQQNNKECDIIKYATDEIMCNPGTEILSAILSKLDLNERTFQRTFKKRANSTSFYFLKNHELNKIKKTAPVFGAVEIKKPVPINQKSLSVSAA
jgi:hypothetical protein